MLIGETAVADAFTQLFPWNDVVIPLAPDGSLIRHVCCAASRRKPQRLETISRRNAAQSLLRHDWSYRWRTIIELAGPGRAQMRWLRRASLAWRNVQRWLATV